MAYNPNYQMSIQDANGNYYYAELNPDASWLVSVSATPYYIVLPDGWDTIQIVWERDPETIGIWRSSTEEGNYKFSMDGRAIIQHIEAAQGIRGYGLLTIYQWQPDFTYAKFYPSELDFNTYKSDEQNELLEISTLDSGLRRDYMAYKDSAINIPFWKLLPGIVPEWVPYNDGNPLQNVWVQHNGLKLIYNSTFISGATTAYPLTFLDITGIHGFNHGKHEASGPNDGRHTLFNLSQLDQRQNNGATSFIGNTILSQQLLTGNQTVGINQPINERNFGGVNDSQPYTRNNYSLKNALPVAPNTFQMNAVASGTFTGATITYTNNGNPCFISFVLFEIGTVLDFGVQFDTTEGNPAIANYTYQTIYQIDLPATGSPYTLPNVNFNNYASPSPVNINPSMVYVIGIIYDEGPSFGGLSGDGSKNVFLPPLSALQFSLLSLSDGGISGIPIPAPQLNSSVFAGYRGFQMLEMLTPLLASTNTDLSGFPVPVVPAVYSGRSDWLSSSVSTADSDTKPFQVVFSSMYSLHSLVGQSYISMSISQLYGFWKKQFGVGMSIENDISGNPTVLRMEPYIYYFPDGDNLANMIIDLGYNVAGLTLENAGQELGIAANLKTGYQDDSDTLNSNGGADVFCGENYWNTPVANIPGTIDLEETDILVEQTAIELARAQQATQPIGQSYNPASPSTDNQALAVYCMPTNFDLNHAVDPGNNVVPINPYLVEQFDGVMNPAAQSNDPLAITNPYIANLNYPDTAINLKLAPGRIFHRYVGNYLHSLLAKMDTLNLIYRKQSVMQYNNVALGLTGITQKLSFLSQTIKEMQDVVIGDLPDPLFQPVIVNITAGYLVNMWQVMNNNPNGFVRFFWKNEGYGVKEYRFYPNKVTYVANQKATQFTGLLCVGYPV